MLPLESQSLHLKATCQSAVPASQTPLFQQRERQRNLHNSLARFSTDLDDGSTANFTEEARNIFAIPKVGVTIDPTCIYIRLQRTANGQERNDMGGDFNAHEKA